MGTTSRTDATTPVQEGGRTDSHGFENVCASSCSVIALGYRAACRSLPRLCARHLMTTAWAPFWRPWRAARRLVHHGDDRGQGKHVRRCPRDPQKDGRAARTWPSTTERLPSAGTGVSRRGRCRPRGHRLTPQRASRCPRLTDVAEERERSHRRRRCIRRSPKRRRPGPPLRFARATNRAPAARRRRRTASLGG